MINRVIVTATQDRGDLIIKYGNAQNEIWAAGDAVWGLWNPQSPPPTSDQLSIAFNRARDVGIAPMVPSHWWSSNTYPGPNGELHISIWNPHAGAYHIWAIVHVKWHNIQPASLTFENVDMVSIKRFDGATIPNSNVTQARARGHMITQALNYKGSATAPRSGNTAMH